MPTNQTEKEEIYNVSCRDCGNAFQAHPRTPLWWRARQFRDRNPTRLDCLSIDGQTCGCINKNYLSKPDAPYRVFGIDLEGQEYNEGFNSFVEVVTFYKEHIYDIPTIKGVSKKVSYRLDGIIS